MATILIVDDTPSNIKVMRTLLTVSGHTVMTAEDGQEAIDKATANPPDIMFMDVVMPVLDGLRACQKLRELPATRAIPIVMVTASGPQERDQALAAGANELVMKPIEPDVILSLIESLVDHGGTPA